MPVNVTDRIIILEQDEAKLSQAINGAVTAVLMKYRHAFIPDIVAIPVAGADIGVVDSLTKTEKRFYRSCVRFCQVLEHFRGQSLDRSFLAALETYLRQPNGKGQVPYINDPAVAEELRIAQGAQPSDDRMRLPARMIFLKLVSMRVLLLPMFGVPTFIPEKFGPDGDEHLLDLLPDAMRELLFTVKPGPSRKTRIDWSVTAGTMATQSLADVGSDYMDWMPGKPPLPTPGYALSLGVATTWHDISDVTAEDIWAAHDHVAKKTNPGHRNAAHRAIKLYLNCLYLCRKSDSDPARDQFFEAIYAVPNYRIYTVEYKIWTKREHSRPDEAMRGASGRRHGGKHHVMASKLGYLASEYILGTVDDDGFVTSISSQGSRRLIMEFDELPPNGPILPGYSFDWQVKMKQWKAAFALFKDDKCYENEDRSIAPFTSFFLYLGVYLPAWSLKNPDTRLAFPEKIVDFKGAIYIYRSKSNHVPGVDKPPLTFRQFNEKYNEGNSKETIANCVRVVKAFFDEIIPSGDILGIPTNLPNPVKDSAIPAGGGRPWGCTKATIPVPVVFLTLLYCYRILDCMYKVNEALMKGENIVLSNYLFLFVKNDRHIDATNTLRNLKDLEAFDLDTSAVFDGTGVNFDLVPKRLFNPRRFPVKGRGELYLLDTGPLEHVTVMFETGLRGQSIQWLDTDFDCHVKGKTIEEHGMYPLHVNTDKVKECAWSAYVAGRVIKLLQHRRDFRDLLEGNIFEQDIYYEGRPNTKWGKFKPVFSTNVETGFPHCDGSYTEVFKLVFHGLQVYIDELGLGYIASVPDQTNEFGFKVDATPHSARRAVVLQHITYLPPEYIGKYITGQTPRTVGYYAAVNPDSFSRADDHQKVFQVVDAARRAVDTSRGPEVTEPHKSNSPVVQAFATDYEQALRDFGAMSTSILDQEVTGSDIFREGRHQKLDFRPTHICPFGGVCPPERRKQRMVGRCNFCDFALRTVDHLPAISSEMRNLKEECHEIDIRLDFSGKSMDNAQRGNLETRRKEINEDLFSLMIVDYILRQKLDNLKDEYRKNPEYFCFTPEIIVKNLEAAPFPQREEGLKYVLSRLKEAKTYVSLHDGTIKANIAKFVRMTMRAGGGLDDLFRDEDLDETASRAYSFVHSYLSAHKLTLDGMADHLSKSVTDVAGTGTAGQFLPPGISNLLPGYNIIGTAQ